MKLPSNCTNRDGLFKLNWSGIKLRSVTNCYAAKKHVHQIKKITESLHGKAAGPPVADILKETHVDIKAQNEAAAVLRQEVRTMQEQIGLL